MASRLHRRGEFTDEMIAMLSDAAASNSPVAQRLRACPPEKLRIVVTHQPMHVPPGRDQGNLLRGHAEINARIHAMWTLQGLEALTKELG